MIQFKYFLSELPVYLFAQSWPWWLAGLGIGLTALGLAWWTGKRLGITGGFDNACSIFMKESSKIFPWKLWFILGLPFGAYLANWMHWNYTWLYGRMDGLTFGNIYMKGAVLFIGGIMVGFGASW